MQVDEEQLVRQGIASHGDTIPLVRDHQQPDQPQLAGVAAKPNERLSQCARPFMGRTGVYRTSFVSEV